MGVSGRASEACDRERYSGYADEALQERWWATARCCPALVGVRLGAEGARRSGMGRCGTVRFECEADL
jgi:hypothetical protein